ncbi:DUF6783 domain-containing protein [uncultured Robinsoniella sp.]|uniref:DUF6783 domain-containing protein n=1 Tax=uncultured Robinsoniella sp. TaxID=904190 RepID=UPI00374FBBB4
MRHIAAYCGIFAPHSGYIARYAPIIRDKLPTNCDVQLPESILKHALAGLMKRIMKHAFVSSIIVCLNLNCNLKLIIIQNRQEIK